jgi:hypothetical protein
MAAAMSWLAEPSDAPATLLIGHYTADEALALLDAQLDRAFGKSA